MIPNNLKIKGLKFILINNRDKIPIEKWTEKQYDYNDEKLLEHIKNHNNYGVVLGNGILVIDADTDRLNKIIQEKFPKTFTVKTKSGCHYYYSCYNFKSKKVLKDKKGHLGEIQYKGQYVVGPKSIHPSGVKYKVVNDMEITSVDNKFIEEHLSKYYAASEKIGKEVILKGAKEGLRNESMFKLACSFKSKGLNIKETFITLKGINEKNNPPLPEYELKTIVESAFSYKNTPVIKQALFDLNDRRALVENFYKQFPFFYDRKGIFWFWDVVEKKYDIVDEIDLMNMINQSFSGINTVSTGVKTEIIEALKQVGRLHIPKTPSVELIQFKDKVFNIKTGELSTVYPDYFFTNPIPWDIGEHDYTPHLDKIFEEWVGKDYVQTLYEILAYCCYRDYPIHLIFCFTGGGRNGKSTFLNLIKKFLGVYNMTSSELDSLLKSRFETFKLYKKLVCELGETNFGSLKKTSLLKKLVGQDLIGFEAKNKQPFDDYNYAKIIIASNSLPTSYDTSDGFYRRWLILNFPNKFKEGRDIIGEINDEEFRNLSRKVLKILPKLIKKGEIFNQGSVEERKRRYIENSNPLTIFLEKYCVEDVDSYISYSKLYSNYVDYLKYKNQRIVSKKEFSKVLDEEGIEKKRTTFDDINDTYVLGYKLKEELLDFD